ncbi:hypothetical protein KZ829_40865 [Actinoplanes hulinensis]|uniref:Transposase n=1 Tax=Actinoplanes hulinensis TaxID=1144547 RepID=A0ABS7BGS6_9ACTN|nr:hypothetical protein [Actinoplanes hulinensis]MBW6440095.1 hypothetical protein [Actinoplanes hulinensis]
MRRSIIVHDLFCWKASGCRMRLDGCAWTAVIAQDRSGRRRLLKIYIDVEGRRRSGGVFAGVVWDCSNGRRGDRPSLAAKAECGGGETTAPLFGYRTGPADREITILFATRFRR